MSDEIRLSVNCQVSNSNLLDSFVRTISPDQAAKGRIAGTATATAVEAALDLSGVTTPGLFILEAITPTGDDPTYTKIQWGKEEAGALSAMGYLEPGQFAVLWLEGSVTIRILAVGGDEEGRLDWRLFEK